VAYGDHLKNNSLHVILKRIILTGYPHKASKKKAIIKLMFFNPKDVRYFMPVQIDTKLGFRVYFIFIIIL
jgi:pre-rRNA-processing protein TSR1